MNNISDCFNIGSIVACRTCYRKDIEGEVLAFDSHSKMLILSILFHLFTFNTVLLVRILH